MPLDIGVGILAALLTAEIFSIELTPMLVLLGILAALLPDIDLVTTAFGRWRHRQLTHYPIVYVPIVVATYLYFGPAYAFLLAVSVYAHLVHDTVGIGWGISWLWPVTRRRYLFPERYRRARYGSFMSFMPEEIPSIETEPTGKHWLRHYYFRPNPLAYIEYGVLFLSIAILLYFIA